jgi:hypothetical protein
MAAQKRGDPPQPTARRCLSRLPVALRIKGVL